MAGTEIFVHEQIAERSAMTATIRTGEKVETVHRARDGVVLRPDVPTRAPLVAGVSLNEFIRDTARS